MTRSSGEGSGARNEPVPSEAGIVFGDGLAGVSRYAELLAGAGVERGLIGPGELGRLWSRHLMNCGVLAGVFERGATVCDVGSGAGLPGVVIAIARPDVRVTLVEPALRRIRFLEEVVADLALRNVDVVRVRAEEHERQYEWVVARAVAPLDRLVRLTYGLLRPGGVLLAMKGSRADEELRAAEATLREVGARTWGIERYGRGVVDTPTTVVCITAGGSQ